ncbi:MAG: beta-N-acetylhexosaminidase [Pseudomonadota bacterium]|nr:beta-N-acetylhexosaminidase [Pseudomonadota bacterium]
MTESSVSSTDSYAVSDALAQAVGVITDIEGTALTDEDRDFLTQPEIAGLIFFARNYESPQQLKALTGELNALRPDLLLTVDQEGGRVQRFRSGFTLFEPMMRYEAIFVESPEKALELARLGGQLLATELIAHGVDLTFAPVLDIERDLSRVIGDRAFGHSADTVTSLARAWCEGLSSAGMMSVGKHFPGHGAVEADSHLELPVDPRDAEALEAESVPFKTLISEGVIQGIMPAHVVYPAIDANHTAGFSSVWFQDILRKQLGFSGIIFSDDLSMEGAASGGDFYQRSIAAAQAGANALVVCNNRQAAKDVVSAVADLYRAGTGALKLESLKPDSKTNVLDDKGMAEARKILGSYQLIRDDNL